MDRDGSDDQDDVIMWLGLAAGLHEDVVNEAKLRLRREHVYVVGDLGSGGSGSGSGDGRGSSPGGSSRGGGDQDSGG